jgi:non-specific serine/threonine protein kinase
MLHTREGQSFGALLRAYRTNAGLTQEQLAERAGLSRRGIADLERGARRAPYAHTLEQLRAALALSPAEYLSLVEASRHPVTAAEPPPATRTRRNLPLRGDSFVGREADRVSIATRLDSARVVTLVGPGGVGKTRLALEVADDLMPRLRDSAWLVELAAVTESAMVPASVAAVLGMQQRSGRDVAGDVLEWLQNKQLLLVLDNCEHLVEACARLAAQIARTCPDVRILATSREVLGVTGEIVHQVNPLAVHAGALVTAQSALDSEAIQLFVDRAVASAPGFILTDRNASHVALVCERLDGLPLALELTAARLRAFSLEDLARRLDQRFTLLTSGNRTALPRHRTLRALVDWSYDLLEDNERSLFEQLSVFSGSWTLDAVEAVCAVADGSTLECLGQLVDKSLVHVEQRPDASARYVMLETLHEYAAERLRVRSHADEVQRRHAEFYATALTRRWGPAWWGERPEFRAALIAADYPNIESGLRWLVAHQKAVAAQRLAGSLAFFWVLRGRVEEGRQWLTSVLGLVGSEDRYDAARADATVGLMQLETEGGNRATALAVVEADFSHIQSFAEPRTLAQALMGLGWLTWVMRHDDRAGRAYLEDGLTLARTLNIGALEALGRARLAAIANQVEDYAWAQRLVQENRAYRLGGGEPLLRYIQNVPEANALLLQGDHAGAEALIAELARDYDPDRHPFEFVGYSMLLSRTRLQQGQVDAAAKAALDALTIAQKNLGRYLSPGHLGSPLETLALIAAAEGDHARALRLEGAAAAFRERDGILAFPRERSLLKRGLAASRAVLGPRASADASAAGRSLSVDDAVADAAGLLSTAYTTAYSAHVQE